MTHMTFLFSELKNWPSSQQMAFHTLQPALLRNNHCYRCCVSYNSRYQRFARWICPRLRQHYYGRYAVHGATFCGPGAIDGRVGTCPGIYRARSGAC